MLFDVDVDHHPVGRRTGLVGDLHGLEEIQTLDAPLGAIDQGAIVGIAFRNIELAPDHVVARARIAADVDALDIGPDPFIDDEDDVDQVVLRVAVAARAHRRKRISVLGDLDSDVFDRLFDRVAVVDVAAMHAQNVLQRYGIDRADIRLNLDIAEVIKGAFLDREGDDEALDGGIVFAGRRDDLHVGIAVGQVETPDQVAVGLDAVGVVDVGGLQKAQEIGGGGLDHLLEPIIRIGVIADEDDGSDAGLFAFPDFEDQVDAIVRPLDDFRHHLHVEAAVAVIDLDDAGDVGLHRRL